MNQQTKWVAERAVVLSFRCPRCAKRREHVMLKERPVPWGERAPVLGFSDLTLLIHCLECLI
jgi:hypothetical protein